MEKFSDAIRDELRALVERKGRALTSVSTEMGRCHIWLPRKLDPSSSQPRSMSLQDVDEVLQHLGEDPRTLLKAALSAK